jgi:NAD(P)H-hydrate repair Nnr-like enzyme with NAD(P)H-hydrate epimerase domain
MALRRVSERRREALHSVGAIREIERAAAATLSHHTLMARAGLAVAELAQALALAPHARCIWLARGPGSNGGDGLVAAKHLHQWAQAAGGHCNVVVTLSTGATIPPDAVQALNDTRSADVRFAEEPPQTRDFGIGATRALEGQLARWPGLLQWSPSPCLCIAVPAA